MIRLVNAIHLALLTRAEKKLRKRIAKAEKKRRKRLGLA